MKSRPVSACLLVLFALMLCAVAAPGWSNAAAYGPKSLPQTTCYTEMLNEPIKKPQTTWSAWTTSCTVLTTVATTTLTIPITTSITSTSTVTVTTTGPEKTQTYTTTLGSMTIVTTTVTRTEESTSATTSTTTIRASSAAQIEDTAQEILLQLPVNKKRSTDWELNVDIHRDKPVRLSDHTRTLRGDVICYHYQSECTTSTVTGTATITATSSTTVTVTATETMTTNPDATTTTTTPATSLSTFTKTVTSTSVTTKFLTAATATFWESCRRANIASSIDHIPVIDGELSSNMRHLSSEAGKSSAYDCCVAAHLHPLSAVWAWEPAEAKCHIFEASTCSTEGQSGRPNKPIISHTRGQPRFLMGNANCGKWTDLKYETTPI